MNASRILIFVFVIGAAIAIGWYIDRPSPLSRTAPLEVPDNVDYYLTLFNYQSLDQLGQLHYQLKSPYLEHFRREDISQIQQPDLNVYQDEQHWHASSESGLLRHETEVLEMNNQVTLTQKTGTDLTRLTSDQIIFISEKDVIDIPVPLNLESADFKLDAGNARLDMKSGNHQFERVKAIYQRTARQVSG